MQRINHILPKIVATLLVAFAVTAGADAADLTLFDGKTVASIAYDGATPVAKAAALLAHDLGALSDKHATVKAGFVGMTGPAVIVGTADSPMIAALLKANNIDAGPIAGKWETYGRAAIPAPWNSKQQVLLIFGSDTRGTIWGVIDLTREMGVSAWEWWADVKIRRVGRIAVDGALHYSKEPSV